MFQPLTRGYFYSDKSGIKTMVFKIAWSQYSMKISGISCILLTNRSELTVSLHAYYLALFATLR